MLTLFLRLTPVKTNWTRNPGEARGQQTATHLEEPAGSEAAAASRLRSGTKHTDTHSAPCSWQRRDDRTLQPGRAGRRCWDSGCGLPSSSSPPDEEGSLQGRGEEDLMEDGRSKWIKSSESRAGNGSKVGFWRRFTCFYSHISLLPPQKNLVFSSKTPDGSKVSGFHPAVQQEDGLILRQAEKSALERLFPQSDARKLREGCCAPGRGREAKHSSRDEEEEEEEEEGEP